MMDAFLNILSEQWLLMAGAAASTLIAAFFAASETAIVYSSRANMHAQADAGNRRAGIILQLLDRREHLHAALLFAENFFIVLAAALGAIMAVNVWGGMLLPVAGTVLAVSMVIVFFTKMVPKGIVARNPDRVALIVAVAVQAAVQVLSPLSRLMSRTAAAVAGPVPQGMACTAMVTEEDIKAMINLGEERGSLKEEEKELLHKVFEFGDTLASQAMRPRTEIVSVPSKVTLQEVLALVSEFGYSRYPVIEDTVDTVTGILYIKDILVAMASGEVKRSDGIQRFVRPAYFIPENKRVSELLSEMQRDRFQIAIVIDEYGGTSGLVTLEDLIEEIVGSIHDELEAEEKDVQVVDERNFVVSGQSPLDEVNELLGTTLHSKDFNTLGGYVFGLFGRMPKIGEQLKYRSLKLEILELEGRKISKIKITKLE